MSPAVLGKKKLRQELIHTKPKTFILSIISGIMLAIHFSAWFESLNHTTIASSAIIVSTEVIWVAIGYRIFLKGRLSRKAILAIVIAFAGSVLIAWNDSSVLGGNIKGDILALIAAIAVGAYTLIGRVVRDTSTTAVYTYIVYVSSAVVLTVASLIQGYPFFGYGYRGILSGFLLAVFCTIMGHSVFSWCLRHFSPAFVSAAKLCEPVIESICAVFLFSEIPTALQIVGCVVVLAGVLYYTIIEMKKEGTIARGS